MRNPDELVKLPFGKQFSPTQIELYPILDFIAKNQPSPEDLKQYVLETFFDNGYKTKALNTYIALREYRIAVENEIIEEKAKRKVVTLTDIGQEMYHAPTKEEFYKIFARHILNDLHGIVMIDAINDLNKMGEKVTASSIAEIMVLKGYDAGGTNGEKLNPIKLWLERAGIFLEGKTWSYDYRKLEEVLGVGIV